LLALFIILKQQQPIAELIRKYGGTFVRVSAGCDIIDLAMLNYASCRFSISPTDAHLMYNNFSPIRDVISGAIMAATSVPQLIAYAETVGYAGYLGLSTAGAPLLAWGAATGKFLFAY
jgi:hypothetical protein